MYNLIAELIYPLGDYDDAEDHQEALKGRDNLIATSAFAWGIAIGIALESYFLS